MDTVDAPAPRALPDPGALCAPPAEFRGSAAEWRARVELAASHRLLAHAGVSDLTYNHLSARVPGEPQCMLIKSRTEMFEEVTASSLLKYALDGTPLDGGPALAGGALVIHAGVLGARPDLHAVFHTHTPANIGVSAQRHGLLMISQHATTFHGRIAYHAFGGFEFDLAQREPLIASLGALRVAILRNHGVLVCGRTIAEAFVEHHFLEVACRAQIAALAGGGEVVTIPDEICAHAARQLARASTSQPMGDKDWPASLRLAMRLDPRFAT